MKKPNAMKPIVVDDDFLVEPVLHDARLYRMDFGGKRVAFYFADTSGQHIKLELHDVVQMSSHGLAEANILLDISVETGPAVRAEVIDRLMLGNRPAQEKYRETVMAQLHSRELCLLQFSPVLWRRNHRGLQDGQLRPCQRLRLQTAEEARMPTFGARTNAPGVSALHARSMAVAMRVLQTFLRLFHL